MKPSDVSIGRAYPVTRFSLELLVGYILLAGVLTSVVLLSAGVVWQWWAAGTLQINYTIRNINFFQFLLNDLRQLATGVLHPQLLINLGLAVLMLTPYVRLIASMLYFALVEHNWKYTIFTGFVFTVLTYSLFLR